jgi:hypothetical protein
VRAFRQKAANFGKVLEKMCIVFRETEEYNLSEKGWTMKKKNVLLRKT